MKTTTIPFPQANNLELMFNIFAFFPEDGLIKEDISIQHKLTGRQGSYYLDALAFLGLIKRFRGLYFLNSTFEKERKKDLIKQRHWFCEKILEHNFLRKIFSLDEDKNVQIIEEEKIIDLLKETYNLSFSTAIRRASCLQAWHKWIKENI